MSEKPTLYCSFCGLAQYERYALFSNESGTAHICEQCAQSTNELVAQKRIEDAVDRALDRHQHKETDNANNR